MVDVFSAEKRSQIMASVRGKDTTPEKIVRSALHRLGFRFRLHRTDLPGKPDIVLPRHKKVIFVHGCFWHGHHGCIRSGRPKSNALFWNSKIDSNVERDKRNLLKLKNLGWKILVVWECETKKPNLLEKKLVRFMGR